MEAESPATDTDALLEFMYRLGQAYLACGEQTAKVELLLRRIEQRLIHDCRCRHKHPVLLIDRNW